MEQIEEGWERDWQRELLISDSSSNIEFDEALGLSGQIRDETLRLQARLVLWARHPGNREATAAVMACERWAPAWTSAEGRLLLAAFAVAGFGKLDLAHLLAQRSTARSALLENLTGLMHAGEHRLELLAPHVDDPLAGDAVLALAREGPLLPEPEPNLEPLLGWFCGRLSPDACVRVASRLRTERLSRDEGMESLARAQILGVLATRGSLCDLGALVDEVIAYAAEVDDEVWAVEPLYRIYPLLPARRRAELSARAPHFMIQALRTEEDPAIWQFAADLLRPALLGLEAATLHEAWGTLLHELSGRERTMFWRLQGLLIAMVEKLGGDTALVACAGELRRVRRLWP